MDFTPVTFSDAKYPHKTTNAHELALSVADNGRGLPEDVVEGGGLTGMRERAMLIGADLQIESVAGSGVSVTVRLRLNGGQACRPR